MVIAELVSLYQINHLAGKPSASSYARIVRQLLPPIAPHPVAALPKPDLLRWWMSISDRPAHANKALGLVRAAHRWALGLGLLNCPDPTIGIKKHRERTRSITTSPDEWAQLVPYLEDLRLMHRTYFWSQYLLGQRPGETRSIRVEHLWLDREIPSWLQATSKTGQPHVVPIPQELVPMWRLLIRVNPPGAPWLFPGDPPSKAWGRTGAQKLWESLRAKAGLHHLWLNDLRRSTASDLLNQGENLGVVQAQLNHRSLSQTAKYAYLAIKPLSDAYKKRTDRILDRIEEHRG